MRKVFGVILCVIGAMALFGAVLNSAWYIGYGDGAALFGYITGQLLALAGFFGGGIFCCLFDRIYKRDYVTGFRMRKKQNVWIITFFMYFGIIAVICFLAGMNKVVAFSYWEAFLLSVLATLVYWIPWIGFVALLTSYTVSFYSCRKNSGYTDGMLEHILANPYQFHPICTDQSVLASETVLFFPKLFCVIPFERIESVKNVNVIISKSIIIKFTNGKRVEIDSKHYDAIVAAVDEYKNR